MANGATTLSRRAFLGSAAAGTAIASTAGSVTAQTTHTVEMTDNLTFEPDSLTVSAGDTVVWDNVGVSVHTVTAYEDRIPADADYFASGGFEDETAARNGFLDAQISQDESYEHTFEVPGTYEYFCHPHENAGMVGTIEVESADGEPTGAAPGAGVSLLPSNLLTGAVLSVIVLAAAAATVYQVFIKGGD